MLSEFVGRIVELGQKAKTVEFHTHPGLPLDVFVRHGDTLDRYEVPAAPRTHVFGGVSDLTAALLDSEIAPAPEVYVGEKNVVALLDRKMRRQRVTLPLVESARFKLCCELERPRAFQPRDLVKFLRLELHGGQHQSVIQAMSRIDFARTSAGKTDVAHGRESLGRSVEATVQQADKVPTDFEVQCPIWSTPGANFVRPIQFGVHLDLEGQAVELRALSDSCLHARNAALAALVGALREALPSIPVFMGAP